MTSIAALVPASRVLSFLHFAHKFAQAIRDFAYFLFKFLEANSDMNYMTFFETGLRKVQKPLLLWSFVFVHETIGIGRAEVIRDPGALTHNAIFIPCYICLLNLSPPHKVHLPGEVKSIPALHCHHVPRRHR